MPNNKANEEILTTSTEDEISESEEYIKEMPSIQCDPIELRKYFIHSSLNIEGNYRDYLIKGLQLVKYLQELDYKEAIKKLKKTIDPNTKKNNERTIKFKKATIINRFR